MADAPVIDLDDTAENRNWLRIVGAARQHDAGELTDEQYQQRLAELRGEVPTSPVPHDPAIRCLQRLLRRLEPQQEAAAVLEEGLELARSLPYPYAEARILAELDRLEEALAIFRRLGARKDIERTEQELAALEPTADPAR
jgi:hypothetical protein